MCWSSKEIPSFYSVSCEIVDWWVKTSLFHEQYLDNNSKYL
jgi:hypothetical protein